MKGCSRKWLSGRQGPRPIAARLSTYFVAIFIAFVPVWHLCAKEALAGTYIRQSVPTGSVSEPSGSYTILARAVKSEKAKLTGKTKTDQSSTVHPVPKLPPEIQTFYPEDKSISDIRVGSSILFSVTAYDISPYAYLNYTWYVDSSVKGNDASFMYAPAAADVGKHKISVKVSNGTLANTHEWSVTVRNFKIDVAVGEHGSISPSEDGHLSAAPGSDVVFTIKPDECYRIEDVAVDGNPVGPVESYKFSNLADDHSIAATFVPASTHKIVSEAKENGTISPSGTVEVKCGEGATFTIKANPHYEVSDVLIDSVPIGAVSTYTFKNVTAGHSISASFSKAPVINVVGTEHGSISPSGNVKPKYLSDQTFSITPDLGYLISDVLVDGNSVGAVESYTFKSVSDDHKIAALFVPNDPPVADAGPDQTVEQGTDVVLSGLNSTDPDDGIASYAWEQIGGPAVTLSNPAEVKTTFTAPEAVPTALTFQLTVTDGGGMQATDTCIVNVVRDRGESRAPVAKAGFDQTVSTGDAVELDGSGSFDFNGGIASYLWEQIAGPAVTLTDPSSPKPGFTVKGVGQDEDIALVFKLTVTDRIGLKATDCCTVNVSSEDDPPTAAVGADQNVREGATVVLDGSKSTASDSGDIAAYVWKQVAGSPVILSSPDDATTSFVAPRVGPEGESLTFRLTVIDDGDLRTSSTTTVFVAHPLSITAPNGGEILHAGGAYTVSWNYSESGANPDVALELLKAGNVVSVIADPVPIGAYGAGSFEWTIPESLEPGNDYAIRILEKSGEADGNVLGSDTSNGSFTITYPAPTPDFSAAPVQGSAPLEVHFSDSSTGSVTSRMWDFGDGATSAEKDPVHKYESSGVYTVSLKVEGPGGSRTETKADLVNLEDQPLVAAFSASERSGPPPLKVSFKDESEGSATSWSWDFGDGQTSGEQNPTHTYTSSGSYNVTLKVEGHGGSNAKTLSDYVTVDEVSYAAAFSADPRSGTAPLQVAFKDESSGEIKSWHWKFGDGQTSEERNPVHIYTSAGTFTVELTVRGADGINAQIKPKFIAVKRSKAAPSSRPKKRKMSRFKLPPGIKIYIPPSN